MVVGLNCFTGAHGDVPWLRQLFVSFPARERPSGLLRPSGDPPMSVVEKVGESPHRNKCPMRAKMVVKMEVPRSWTSWFGWGVPSRVIRQRDKCQVCHKFVWDARGGAWRLGRSQSKTV